MEKPCTRDFIVSDKRIKVRVVSVSVPEDNERVLVEIQRIGYAATLFRLDYAEAAELRNQLNSKLSQLRKERIEG